MTRRELQVIRGNRKDITDAVRQILYDLDCDMPNPPVRIVLYADEAGNVEVQPHYNTGRDWPDDEEHTIHTVNATRNGDWMQWYTSVSDICEALDMTEDELLSRAAEVRGVSPALLDLRDIMLAIHNSYDFADERNTLFDTFCGALRENFWSDYGREAAMVVARYICARQEEIDAADPEIQRHIALMREVARHALELVTAVHPEKHLTITYAKGSEYELSDWERKYHDVLPGDAYFFIHDNDDGFLLYAVNVSADSVLTAAYELFRLIHTKF